MIYIFMKLTCVREQSRPKFYNFLKVKYKQFANFIQTSHSVSETSQHVVTLKEATIVFNTKQRI